MSWSVRSKLFLSFGVVIAVVTLLGGIVLLRMREAGRLAAEQDRHQEIAFDTERLMTLLVQSRRHEKDFFDRSDAKDEQLHEDRRREFHDLSTSLRGKLVAEDGELVKRLDAVDAEFDKYQTTYAAAVAVFKKRGGPDAGLQGEFRQAAHELEQLADDAGDDRLDILVLQMRRHEKDYLNRENIMYVDQLHTVVKQIREHALATANAAHDTEPKRDADKDAKDNKGEKPADAAPKHEKRLTPAEAARVATAVDVYVAKFDAAVDAMKELARLKEELHAETSTSEDALNGLINQALALANTAKAASLAVEKSSEIVIGVLFGVTLLAALIVARLLSAQLMRAIGDLTTGTRTIAAGDLRMRVAVTTGDELGELGTSFNKMVGSLNEMTGNITTATSSMEEMVSELQATVAEQAASLQQQAASVGETVTTATQLARSSEQVSDVARRVLDEASRSVETSGRGLDAIRQSVQGMNDVREQVQNIASTILDLSEKTQQIGTIISTVDDFAERSSLLALNASIEAARAGEAGKAFSVVAGEVKSLAEQSQRATERVREILSDIQRTTHTAVMVTEEGSKRVDRGVELTNGAGEIISTLSGAITLSAESARQIVAAAKQQSNGIEQISTAMAGIEQFSRQNVQATKQTETAAHTLAAVSKQLRSTAAQYQR